MALNNEQIAAQLRCPSGEDGLLFGQTMNLRNLPMILGALQQLDIREGHRILEAGCGDGGLLGYILSLASGLRYTGMDISATMIEAARSFNAPFIQAGMAEYVLVPAQDDWSAPVSGRRATLSTSVLRFPFADESFDRLLSVNMIYFLPDLHAWMAEASRVLKPSGRLCLSFSERAFMQKLPFAQHGFRLYDASDVVNVAAQLPFRLMTQQNQQDMAVSKSGQLVRRPFVHLVFERSA